MKVKKILEKFLTEKMVVFLDNSKKRNDSNNKDVSEYETRAYHFTYFLTGGLFILQIHAVPGPSIYYNPKIRACIIFTSIPNDKNYMCCTGQTTYKIQNGSFSCFDKVLAITNSKIITF